MGSLVRSVLDCDRFGVEAYRIAIESAADVRAAVEDRRAALIVARVATERLALVQSLERGGFFLCDTLIYYRGATAGFDKPGSVEGLVIRDAVEADRTTLERTARAAFTNFFGHYHADPRLDDAAATEGYVEWCLSALEWSDGRVLIAVDGDLVAGFATVRVADGAGEIVLNGVAPEYQRRGVYQALVRTVGHDLRDSGVKQIFSSTQLVNLGPQKTWARCGLLPAESCYTLHRWSDG